MKRSFGWATDARAERILTLDDALALARTNNRDLRAAKAHLEGTVSSIDLEPHVPERETSVQRYDDCRGAVELWTVKGGGHYVALQPPALEAIWDFVQAHPKGGA